MEPKLREAFLTIRTYPMIKAAGIILLSASVYIYGTFLSRRTGYTQAVREEILSLLKAMERDIKYGRRPISEILTSFNAETQSVQSFIHAVSDGKCVSVEADRHFYNLSLSERDKITRLFSEIGKSSSSDKELILCRNCIDFFGENNAKTKKDSDSGSLLYRRLGLIGGILTIIILI